MIQFVLYLGKLLLASQGTSSSVLLDADRNAKHVVCPILIVNLNALNYLPLALEGGTNVRSVRGLSFVNRMPPATHLACKYPTQIFNVVIISYYRGSPATVAGCLR